jgi:hypothetical protein
MVGQSRVTSSLMAASDVAPAPIVPPWAWKAAACTDRLYRGRGSGSPVSSSDLMLAISAGTPLVTAR